MEKATSEECSAVALYGFDPVEGLMAAFYRDVVGWFSELGCSADSMAVTGAGHSGNMTSFRSADAKLQRTGFESVESISLVSLLPDARIPVNDYVLTTYCSLKRSNLFIVARSSIAPLTRLGMLPVAEKLIRGVRPKYGIGYTRNHNLGPAMYAIGISQRPGVGRAGDEYLDGLNISFWGDAEQDLVWNKGILRDVYPWNFLNPMQLANSIHDSTLEQWIRADARRGILSPSEGGLAFWEVGEESVSEIRRELWKAGLIFDWTRHIEGADKHPYANAARERWERA